MKTRLSESWVEDKDVTHCPQCKVEFTLFLRKVRYHELFLFFYGLMYMSNAFVTWATKCRYNGDEMSVR